MYWEVAYQFSLVSSLNLHVYWDSLYLFYFFLVEATCLIVLICTCSVGRSNWNKPSCPYWNRDLEKQNESEPFQQQNIHTLVWDTLCNQSHFVDFDFSDEIFNRTRSSNWGLQIHVWFSTNYSNDVKICFAHFVKTHLKRILWEMWTQGNSPAKWLRLRNFRELNQLTCWPVIQPNHS